MATDGIKVGTMWNEAARSGLILGLFTGIFIFTGLITGKMETGGFGSIIAGTILGILLWFLKFFGCLWILKHQMIRYSGLVKTSTPNDLFRFGMLTALASAIIVAGLQLLNITVISQDSVKEAVEESLKTYSSMMALSDSDMTSIEKTLGDLPLISFFTVLIYCFLYGTIASRIISRTIPSAEAFDSMMHEMKKMMHKENLSDEEFRRECLKTLNHDVTEDQDNSGKSESTEKPEDPEKTGEENDRTA